MFLPVDDRTPFYAGAGLGTLVPTKSSDVLKMTVLVMDRAANITIGVVTPCTMRPTRTYGVCVLEMTIVSMQLPLHLSTTPVCMTSVTRGMQRMLTETTTLTTDRLSMVMNIVVSVTLGTDTMTLTSCTTTLEIYVWSMVVTVLTTELRMSVNVTDDKLTMSEHCVLKTICASMLWLRPLALNRRVFAGVRQSLATVTGSHGATIGVNIVVIMSSRIMTNETPDFNATPPKWPNSIPGPAVVVPIILPRLNSTLYCFNFWAN